MFKFLKNKKGSALLETIILWPFFIWLIFISVTKLMIMTERNTAENLSKNYSRTLTTALSFEQALDDIAYDYNSKRKSFAIVNITVGDFNLDFTSQGTGSFESCILDNKFEVSRLNSITTPQNIEYFHSCWKAGTTCSITVSKNLGETTFKSFTTGYFYDPVEGKRYELSLPGTKETCLSTHTGILYTTSKTI